MAQQATSTRELQIGGAANRQAPQRNPQGSPDYAESKRQMDFADRLVNLTSKVGSALGKHEKVDEDKPLPEIEFPFEKGRIPTWIYNRGISKESLLRWEAGVDDRAGLALPVRDSGSRMIGGVLRQRIAEPRYLYYPGMKKSQVLFGQHLLPDHVKNLYIVEGSLDAIWLDQHGYPVVS